MLFDIRDDGLINTSVREICGFLRRSGDAYSGSASVPAERMKKGAAFHRQFQSRQSRIFDDYSSEVRLSSEVILEVPFILNLSGIADGIAVLEDGGVIIDEIKTTRRDVSALSFGSIPEYDLQLYLYAYMYMRSYGKEELTLRLIYHNCDSDETNAPEKLFTKKEADSVFNSVIEELMPWIRLSYEHRKRRDESVSVLPFPFGEYRKGQRELCAAVFRTVRDSENLFAEAPTGIGKTISTLFPAYKALGEDRGDKIFYLTAKTVQRGAAMSAIEKMRESGLYTRAIMLTAKSKSCLAGGNCMPSLCKYSDGCFDRMNAAIWDVITSELVILPETVAAYAEKHCVCPHELALDVSYFCDCVIGDYNHLYDPRAALQRYFSVGGDYIALVDEAHNLPDRARDMYTAEITDSTLKKAHKDLKDAPKRVRRHFSALAKEMKALSKEITDDTKPVELGCAQLSKFEDILCELCDAYKSFLGTDTFIKEKEKTLEVFFDCSFLSDIVRLASEFQCSYRFYIESFGKETKIRYMCTNPSPFIGAIAGSIRSTVYFSATLCPFDYYTDLLLMDKEKDKYIRLPSPFPPENKLVAVYDAFSTRLRDREGSYGTAAKIIHSAICGKIGNYIAFFPSFKYLSDVLFEFSMLYPNVKTVVQESSMEEDARKDFLSAFEEHGSETLLGFAVCGGLFSEGIDLVGERLSGVIVFGTGMPSICFERDLIRQSFEDEQDTRRGFSYAYTYPGLNRVFQAAGRVIRTETDKGFIVLCDDRYSTSEYKKHLIESLSHKICKVRSTRELEAIIGRFYGE